LGVSFLNRKNEKGMENWENFFEKKFSQTLSKNFD